MSPNLSRTASIATERSRRSLDWAPRSSTSQNRSVWMPPMVEVAHADARQAHMHAFLPDVVEKFESHCHKDVLIVGRMRQPALCRATASIRILEFERHRGAR